MAKGVAKLRDQTSSATPCGEGTCINARSLFATIAVAVSKVARDDPGIGRSPESCAEGALALVAGRGPFEVGQAELREEPPTLLACG